MNESVPDQCLLHVVCCDFKAKEPDPTYWIDEVLVDILAQYTRIFLNLVLVSLLLLKPKRVKKNQRSSLSEQTFLLQSARHTTADIR